MAGYVELHCHSRVLVPRRGVAARGARGAGGRARVRGARAHRPRRPLRLARVRARGEGFGVRPITGAEVTLDGGAHVTLLVEIAAGLREPLPAADGRPRGNASRQAAKTASRCRPSVPLELVAELSEGLVCLSGCARDGLGVRDPNGAARLAGRSARALLRRAPAAVRAGRRPAERAPPRPRRAPRRGDGRNRRRPRASPAAHAAPGRPRRDPLPHLARRLRAGAAREPRELPALPQEMLERFSFDRAAAERSAELARRLEFDLTEELGYRYPDFSDREEPAIRQLAAICRARARRALPTLVPTVVKRQARARLDDELALIDELGLAGFFLLHHEVLELAREARSRCAALGSPRQVPAARARARQLGRLDRLLPHRPLARRPGRKRALARDAS